MTDSINLTIVGAGSSYTPELISGIIAQPREDCPVTRLRLTDLNEERLDIMAALGKRMFKHAGLDIQVDASPELPRMLEGADFVVSQIRVGGMDARYLDETIPQKYGILGQETTGPGGMFKALRTIPPMLEIANTVVKECPDAFILNYTNPSGIITEAVLNHTKAKLIGLCSGIPGIQRRLREQFADTFPELKSYCVGLNHLGFLHRFMSDSKDVTAQVLERVIAEADASNTDSGRAASARMVEIFDAIPIGYVQLFLNRAQKREAALNADLTRAQRIMEIEKAVFAEARLETTVEKPAALKKRGGGGYSWITFSFLKAILKDSGEELVCSALNNGCVKDIEDNAVVELACRVDRNGATPLPVGSIPLAYRGLVQTVKAYESLTVEAAMQRSRKLVIQALLNHPLAGDLDVVEPLVDEMLQAHDLSYN